MRRRTVLHVVALVSATVLSIASCSDTTNGAPMTSNDLTEQSARTVLQGYLQETLSVLPAGTTLKENIVQPALDCDDNAVAEGGPKFAGYVTVAEGLPAGQEVRSVDIVVEHWQQLGWTLQSDDREKDPLTPFVGAKTPDGYVVALSVRRDVGLIVKGSTPCFPAATELDHVSPVTIR